MSERDSAVVAEPMEAIEAADAMPAPRVMYQLHRVPKPEGCAENRILWGYVVSILALHLLIPLAFLPYLFSWTGVVLVFLGNYVFCSMGIGAGYHRLLTHRGFQCSKRFEHFLALLGVCTLQDSPARWVLIHRLHHNNSDEQPDPHTPMVNWWWGHVGWLFVENKQVSNISTYEKYVRDLLEDPFYLKFERNGWAYWVFLLHAIPFFIVGFVAGWLIDGSAAAGLQFGYSILFWGVVMRTIFTWHVTWGINSASHIWGYRTYETGENSRNNWLFALGTNGEGWHNNHHADPRSARHGHAWWEVDVTWITLVVLEKLGIIWNVVRPRYDQLSRRRAVAG